MKIKIRKGDKVVITAGKDRTKTGVVERVLSKSGYVIVRGLNVVKKHVKVSKKNPGGGMAEIAMPLPASKVMLICPNCNKRARVRYETRGKEKNRVCKKCSKVITIKVEKGKKDGEN